MVLVSKHIKKHSPGYFDYSTHKDKSSQSFDREWQMLLAKGSSTKAPESSC